MELPNVLLFTLSHLSCALKELESLGKDLYGAKIILQRFQTRRCEHFKDPVPASECLLSMLEDTNPHNYFVATQVHIKRPSTVPNTLTTRRGNGKYKLNNNNVLFEMTPN